MSDTPLEIVGGEKKKKAKKPKPRMIENRRIVSIDFHDGRSIVLSAQNPTITVLKREVESGLVWGWPLIESAHAEYAEDHRGWLIGVVLDEARSVGFRMELVTLELRDAE